MGWLNEIEGQVIISIHSAARAETVLSRFNMTRPSISIHSAARAETQMLQTLQAMNIISIHSAARAET